MFVTRAEAHSAVEAAETAKSHSQTMVPGAPGHAVLQQLAVACENPSSQLRGNAVTLGCLRVVLFFGSL